MASVRVWFWKCGLSRWILELVKVDDPGFSLQSDDGIMTYAGRFPLSLWGIDLEEGYHDFSVMTIIRMTSRRMSHIWMHIHFGTTAAGCYFAENIAVTPEGPSRTMGPIRRFVLTGMQISCAIFPRIVDAHLPISRIARYGKRAGVCIHQMIKHFVPPLSLANTRLSARLYPRHGTVQRIYIQVRLHQQ